MNKNDLVQQLSDRAGLGKTEATKALDAVFDIIAEASSASTGAAAGRSAFGRSPITRS